MNSFSSQHLNSKIYIDILGKILLPVMHSIHTILQSLGKDRSKYSYSKCALRPPREAPQRRNIEGIWQDLKKMFALQRLLAF